jgi:hypothetical protein
MKRLMGAFLKNNEVVNVGTKTCPMCAGLGQVEDFDDHLPSIVDALEFRREQMGWTQMRMAAELGWGRGHYSEFKNGTRGLSYRAMCRAYELGVPAAVLLQPHRQNQTPVL